jgi:hypothetical protein
VRDIARLGHHNSSLDAAATGHMSSRASVIARLARIRG